MWFICPIHAPGIHILHIQDQVTSQRDDRSNSDYQQADVLDPNEEFVAVGINLVHGESPLEMPLYYNLVIKGSRFVSELIVIPPVGAGASVPVINPQCLCANYP
jgi:hypothetical protein